MIFLFTDFGSRLAWEGDGNAPQFFKWFAAEQSVFAAVVFALAGILVFILLVKAAARLVKTLLWLAVLLLLLWYGGFVSTDWRHYKARFAAYVEDAREWKMPQWAEPGARGESNTGE